jgi:hypothetical protein
MVDDGGLTELGGEEVLQSFEMVHRSAGGDQPERIELPNDPKILPFRRKR